MLRGRQVRGVDFGRVVPAEAELAKDGVEVTSILLEPIPITKDNLDVVLDAGWIDQATLCQGVDAAEVPVCA